MQWTFYPMKNYQLKIFRNYRLKAMVEIILIVIFNLKDNLRLLLA